MLKCTCYHSAPYQPIRPLKDQITPEQDAKIRNEFSSKKPMLPIVCLYPFLQKYFVQGLTLVSLIPAEMMGESIRISYRPPFSLIR